MNQNLAILISLIILWIAFLSSNVVREELAEKTGEVVRSCVDPDEMDIFVEGETIVDGQSVVDYCVDGSVVEFYCDWNRFKFRTFVCEFGCSESEGACGRGKIVEQVDQKGAASVYTVGKGGDKLEINEDLGDVVEAITESEVGVLHGGVLMTGAGATSYEQFLRFKDGDLKSGKVVFAESEDDEVGDFLYFKKDDAIFEHEIVFSDGLESVVKENELVDLDDERLYIFDKLYEITEARLNGNEITLRLIGGAVERIEQGSVGYFSGVDGGGDLEIYVEAVDDSSGEVSLVVNGERVKLEDGEATLVNGVLVGVADVFQSSAGEGQDSVEIAVGAELIEFRDRYDDDIFSSGVKVSGEAISEGVVKIKANKIGDVVKIFSIKYRLKASAARGGDIFVEPGSGLREKLRHGAGMIGNWDIIYKGLSSAGRQTVADIESSGTAKYKLSFTAVNGRTYNIDFILNSGGNLKIGSEENVLHFVEGTSISDFVVKRNDYFVLTDKNDKTGVSSIVRYSGIDSSNKVLSFDEVATGGNNVPYSGSEGSGASGDLIVNGRTFRVYVGAGPDYKLAVDLNSDGDVGSDEVNIVLIGGGILDIGSSSSPGGSFDLKLTTQGKQFDEGGSDEVLTINIKNTGGGVDLDLPSQGSLTIETEDGMKKALSNFGVYLEQNVDDGADDLRVEYPKGQALADVEIVFYSGAQGMMFEKKVYSAEPEVGEIETIMVDDMAEEISLEEPRVEEPREVDVDYSEDETIEIVPWWTRLFDFVLGLVR